MANKARAYSSSKPAIVANKVIFALKTVKRKGETYEQFEAWVSTPEGSVKITINPQKYQSKDGTDLLYGRFAMWKGGRR